ncbi:MAG: twin-arginine translocase subunit TatC, partial [Bacteroidales bacterium]|nr:twin-arginine translocase subunit TatC [Bacteroidales bacterium]
RHAFLAVLVIAAMITPSTDIFTMFVTALPLQLVFELSVLVARRAERTEQK